MTDTLEKRTETVKFESRPIDYVPITGYFTLFNRNWDRMRQGKSVETTGLDVCQIMAWAVYQSYASEKVFSFVAKAAIMLYEGVMYAGHAIDKIV